MKNVIFTACNEKYGDFLANHWYKSLKDNANLDNVDVVIMDYGLSSSQKKRLTGAKLVKCKMDGHIVNIRFRDMLAYLKKNKYDQVACFDGGDIIFQDDFTEVFETNKAEFRAVTEYKFSLGALLFYSFNTRGFTKNSLKKIINAGVLFGPYKKMVYLMQEIVDKVPDMSKVGPDQVIVNNVLRKDGFVELDEKYNFLIKSSKVSFKFRDGIFYSKGQVIPIVHNAGGNELHRSIINFGYNQKSLRIKKVWHFINRVLVR